MKINNFDPLSRGSVRAFSKDKILTDEMLDELLEGAAQAPTTGNMQLYSVVVTRHPEAIERMARLHLGQPAAVNCQALLTFCADKYRFGRWCRLRKARTGFENLSGDLLAIVDATIFAEQFTLLAEASGLGCCYLGTVTYDLDGFSRELKLPRGVVPLFSIAVGWPAEDAAPHPCDRLPLRAVVHREEYRDYSDADIEEIYSAKEALPESPRFIAENGKETLAQVYAEVRYPEELNRKISSDLTRYLDI
ncbi:MAG: nitroreductase family protein [Muribaculaceae bacterium]|nr:nitroreductase family protein [Muribaculaceae bacterium]